MFHTLPLWITPVLTLVSCPSGTTYPSAYAQKDVFHQAFPSQKVPSMPRRAPHGLCFSLMDRLIDPNKTRKVTFFRPSRKVSRDKNIILGYNYQPVSHFWIQLSVNQPFLDTIIMNSILLGGYNYQRNGSQSAMNLDTGWDAKTGGNRSTNGADLDDPCWHLVLAVKFEEEDAGGESLLNSRGPMWVPAEIVLPGPIQGIRAEPTWPRLQDSHA
jgi:hypothetical protein